MELKSLPLILILFFSTKVYTQIPLQIEKNISDAIIAISQDKVLPADEVNALYPVYYPNPDKYEFEEEYDTALSAYDSLRNYITALRPVFDNITNDSALALLNQYYLRISNTFYNYFKKRFFSSPKVKIIFFSSSVSCACTLELCKNQLIDILKFKTDYYDKFDYWVIDSYENNELQIKYDTYFAPSVIVFNRDNEIITKIEYDEKMIQKLTDFLTLEKAGVK
jgi:hypothetical protein